jgi:putative hemolysin
MEIAALGIVLVLLAWNAAFAGTEFALLSLRTPQVRRLRERGARGRAVAELVEDPNRYLAAIQIGVTLAGFLASAVSAVIFAEPLAQWIAFLGAAARPTAVVLVTVVLVFLTLVLGELVPKRFAMQRATGWALIAGRPLTYLATAARPIVWLLSRATDAVIRALGGDPDVRYEEVTRGEITDLVAGHRSFPADQREIVLRSLELGGRTLADLAVPRRRVVGFQAEKPTSSALDALVAAGHSRAPVFDATGDRVIGTVHVRDLIDRAGTVGDRREPGLTLPDWYGVAEALRALREAHRKLAAVTDRHGDVRGIVTIEDLAEAIVGDVRDAEEAAAGR